MSRFAVAVDIGGTFTDFVLLDSETRRITTTKVLSTPSRSEDAIFAGIEQLRASAGLDLSRCDLFLHATTLITNAVIERRGYDFILLHTDGFGTTLETGREHRYNVSNLRLAFPKPLTRHRLKVPVRERVAYTGDVMQSPDRAETLEKVRRVLGGQSRANFAVCFLHSHQNPLNEQQIGQWLKEEYPDAAISLSSAIAPRAGEYERWMTCVVNAYTKPLLEEYALRLESKAEDAGFRGRLLMMTSSGLPLPLRECIDIPVRLIESGPAAGVLAAREIAERNTSKASGSTETILAYDMGGTTAKGAFLVGGRIDVHARLEVAREGAFEPGSGFPLMIPAIDLIEIGAGGGSIAEVDARGAIAVGPRSAGADPGPACYGRGGREATVTDANMLLGFLGEANFHASGIQARGTEAEAVIRETIADPLGLSVERAAVGIHRTINENVARAFRVHAAELGVDFRQATLVCTGGSSPIHAVPIAQLLSIRRVIFPFAAGVASAMGSFASSEGIVLQRTRNMALADVDEAVISKAIRGLVEGVPYASQLLTAGANTAVKLGMRYEGQDTEITVPVGRDDMFDSTDEIRCAFLKAYEDIFGLNFPEYEVEVSTWIVEIVWPEHLKSFRHFSYDAFDPKAVATKADRSCYLGTGNTERRTNVPVFNRYALPVGWKVTGPALIEENDTTIYLPAGVAATVAATLDLIAELPS